MGFADFMMGTPSKIQALPTGTKEQQGLFGQVSGGLEGGGGVSQLLQYLQQLMSGDDSTFQNQAMSQFKQQIAPGIAEDYAGLGAGSMSSSGFQQAMGAAGADLAERLALHRQVMQQQGASQYQNLLSNTLQSPQFQYQQTAGTEGMLKPIMDLIGLLGGSFISQFFKKAPTQIDFSQTPSV